MALGTILTLVLVEYGLSLISRRIISPQKYVAKSITITENGKINVLCLGDSFTYGLGASSTMSYPEQLQRMFDKHYGSDRVKVINGGVITYNTTQVRKKFDEILAESAVDYAVVLAGGANEWNFNEIDFYRNDYGLTPLEKLFGKITSIITNLNIYKFIRLIAIQPPKNIITESEKIPDSISINKIENMPEIEVIDLNNYSRCKGFEYAKNGYYDEALVWFNKKLLTNTNNPYLHLGMAYTYYLMKDFEKSEMFSRSGIEKSPDNAMLYTALGYSLFERSNYVEALKLFDKSEKLSPGNKYNEAGIKKILNFQSVDNGFLNGIDNESTIQNLEKNLKIKSDYIRLIGYYNSLQNYEKTKSTYIKYLLNYSDDVEAMQRFALFLLQERSFEESRRWYLKAVNIRPERSTLYTAIGQTYLAEEKFDQVLNWYKKAIETDPNELDGYYKLVELINICKTRSFEIDKDDILSFINKFVDNSKIAKSYYGMIKRIWNDDTINEWIETDLLAIIKTAKQNGVTPVLQSYPYISVSNPIAGFLAKQNNTLFVDHTIIFDNLIKTGTLRDFLFSGDGHCNDKGYEVMAKSIFEQIKTDSKFDEKLSARK